MIQMEMPKPNPRQILAFLDKHKYVGFGGARGGGKSWFVRWKAILLCLNYAGIKVTIVRKTFPELRENHIEPLLSMIPRGVATYNDSKKVFKFRNGSRIIFRHCETERDVGKFQGTEMDVLFIDEGTHFDEETFKKMSVCVRGVNNFPKRVFITCNPGGPGHAWVKRLFIERNFRDGENPEDYAPMIRSLVDDNKALLESNPDYVRQLDALNGKLKAAWRYGDWSVFEGQYFEEFRINPNPKHQWTHVIPAFDPPAYWKRFRSYDFGYNRPFSCAWWVQDPDGRLYRILELYGCEKDQPNVGVRWTTEKQFEKIKRIENEHPWLAGHDIEGVADPSIWNENGGVSVADVAARKHVFFQKGDNARIPGWMQMHYRFAFDEEGRAMLYVFENCKAFIRTIPTLIYDEHEPEDLDTKGEDHVADEARYMCMLNPIPPRIPAEPKPREYDPLDRTPISSGGNYEFFRM